MKLKYFVIAGVCVALIITAYLIGMTRGLSTEDEYYQNVSEYWACMDGCYNMQLLVNNVSSFEYDDIGNYTINQWCNFDCCNQYMSDCSEEQFQANIDGYTARVIDNKQREEALKNQTSCEDENSTSCSYDLYIA